MYKAIFTKIWTKLDWKLLLFLLLFLNVKLAVKVIAIILIYCLRPHFRFGFKLRNSRLPFFYIIITGIALLNWLIGGGMMNFNYGMAMLTGLFFWTLCILASHQVKLAVEKNDAVTIQNTILAFFIVNAVASIVVYTGIIIETGTINPYRYQGNFQKYFMGTGDYIKGITMDTSTANAVLNAFAVIYFLQRRLYLPMLMCMFVLLMTGSNITNLLLLAVLLYVFIFCSNRDQKSMIVVCLAMLLVFMIKVSPQNNKYMSETWDRMFKPKSSIVAAAKTKDGKMPGAPLSPEEQKHLVATRYLDSMSSLSTIQAKEPGLKMPGLSLKGLKEKPVIPEPSIHSASFQHKYDTTVFQQSLIAFAGARQLERVVKDSMVKYSLPGKIIALKQMVAYFRAHPFQLLMGTGMGNFSSRLAFRTTALKIAGGYPQKYAYISPAFASNHFDVYLFYFTRNQGLHSLVNSPNSAWYQLLGEYGLAGACSFILFYLGFFIKKSGKFSQGMPLLIMMTGILMVDYWFELLSAVVFFELLMFLNIKNGFSVNKASR